MRHGQLPDIKLAVIVGSAAVKFFILPFKNANDSLAMNHCLKHVRGTESTKVYPKPDRLT